MLGSVCGRVRGRCQISPKVQIRNQAKSVPRTLVNPRLLPQPSHCGFGQSASPKAQTETSAMNYPQYRYIALVSKFIQSGEMNFMETRKTYTCTSCGYKSTWPLPAYEMADCRRVRLKWQKKLMRRRIKRGAAIALAILIGALLACL